MRLAIAACASALLAACSTPSIATTQAADVQPDPRQGAEVQQVCFRQQIHNWTKNDSRSVIISMKNKDEYKLELIGACNPDDAFLNIGLASPSGSGCFSPGATLSVSSSLMGGASTKGSCAVRKIYKWDGAAAGMRTGAARL